MLTPAKIAYYRKYGYQKDAFESNFCMFRITVWAFLDLMWNYVPRCIQYVTGGFSVLTCPVDTSKIQLTGLILITDCLAYCLGLLITSS